MTTRFAPSVFTPAATIPSAVANSAKEKVLIVDDSRTVRVSIAKRLAARHHCLEADSFMQALEQMREHEFAVVLADIRLPGPSGVELLRKIIEKYPDTAVIMISGIDAPHRVLDAVRVGAFDYLIKPLDLDILELTIKRAIERRNLILDARRYKADLEARNVELANGKAQLQRLQAEIVQNAKMASLGQLAAGIAHELNNPVGFVYGNIDMLRQTAADLRRLLNAYDAIHLPEEIAETINTVKNEINYEATLSDLESIICDCREGAERIKEIVQNLRTFSRLDEAEFKKTDVHEGINSTLRLLSRYFTESNIALVRDFADLPPIDAFAGQLNQVWMNLLANAAQAVGETGGEVRITTQRHEDFITVAVSDTGTGIPEEHLDRIFDPFFTTKPVGEGTGLGLSISFGIVERHGGTIQVSSRLGEGATFTVKLPITAPARHFEQIHLNQKNQSI